MGATGSTPRDLTRPTCGNDRFVALVDIIQSISLRVHEDGWFTPAWGDALAQVVDSQQSVFERMNTCRLFCTGAEPHHIGAMCTPALVQALQRVRDAMPDAESRLWPERALHVVTTSTGCDSMRARAV